MGSSIEVGVQESFAIHGLFDLFPLETTFQIHYRNLSSALQVQSPNPGVVFLFSVYSLTASVGRIIMFDKFRCCIFATL